MDFTELNRRGLVLLGCGRMGSAMLEGWLKGGLAPEAVHVIDPNPSEWLAAQPVILNEALPDAPAVVVIAVKPQLMQDALPQVAQLGGGETVVVSVAAGITLAGFEQVFGAATPIMRTIPNTPAAIGKGITAMIGNASAGETAMTLAEGLLSAIGQVERLTSESQMDAVTGLSGSGPAYVFHLIEALAAAGEAEGLPSDMALRLATATVAGAGALAEQTGTPPADLRKAVTSPNGTTQAGLEVLMNPHDGLPPLIERTVAAATARSKELANG